MTHITHINELRVRIIAFFVSLLGITYLFIPTLVIPLLLLVDFALRAFDLGKFSPLGYLANGLLKLANSPVKLVFYPPKRFAARIGLIFSLVILILNVTQLNGQVIVGILVLFAGLESLAGICAGCYVYNWIMRFVPNFNG